MAARPAGIVALAFALLAAGADARSAGPTLTAAPSVSGTLKAGSRLAAGTGTWTSTTTMAYTYQWYRCDQSGAHCSSIHGATGPKRLEYAAPVPVESVARTVKPSVFPMSACTVR